MPADVAAPLLAVLYLVPGLALLWASGLLEPTPTGALAAAGLGYVAGLAAVLLAGVLLLCAGVPVTIPTLVVVAVVLTAAGVGAALRDGRRPPWPLPRVVVPAPRTWNVERWIVTVTLVVLAVYAVLGYNAAVEQPLTAWDSWSIWGRKAILLSQTGTLPTFFLT